MDEGKQINRNSEGLEKISLGSITVSIDNAKNGAKRPNVRHVPRQDTVDVWSILSGSLLSEVRTRGTIKFKGVKNVYRDPRARFVVVDDNADTKKVLEVFTKGWKLGKPKLLVNICGGDEKFEMNNHLKEMFRHSLLHAARNIDAWILTNGLNSGVMKFLGRSLRDFAVSSANRRGKNTFPIGIVDLNTIENGSCFRQSHNSNSRCEVVYDIMNRESDPDGDTTVHLNPYHPYFVLVDSDSEQSRSKCNEFRCAFMDQISDMKLMGTNTTIPVVTLVVGGGAQSIHIAHRLAMNRSPLVILAGSGGAADILEFAYRYIQSGGGIKREDEIKFTSGLNARLQSSCGPEDRVELLAKCKEMVRRKYNVAIYHLHGTNIPTGVSLCPAHEDIVEAIIASLPKGEKGNQLHLAVVWNLLELVKRYLKENRSWKDDDLHRSFGFALCNDQTDIIDQFLQHGINVQDFLNQSKLTELYAKIVDDCLLKDMLEEKRFKLGTAMTLKVVAGVIMKLCLPGYQPLYERHEDNTFDNPMRELFIWAVLQMRIKTAKLFWFEDKSPLGGALLACKMMKAMSEYEQDPQQIDQMDTLACEYERWAVEILDDYYKEDRRKTSLSIIRELEDWGRVSCLCLASSGRMKRIIAHPAVQNLLDEIWSGKIKSNSEIKHIASLMLPFLSPFLLHYRRPIDRHGVAVQHLKKQKSTGNDSPDTSAFDSSGLQSQSSVGDYSSRPAWNLSMLTFGAIDKVRGYGGRSSSTKSNSNGWDGNYSRLKKIGFFMTAPFIIFRYDVISYLTFCALFTYMLLYEFRDEPSKLEYVLTFWLGTLALDEVRQIQGDPSPKLRKRILAWLTGYWNIVDMVSIILFSIGIGLRHYQPTRDAARVFLALDLVVFLLRSLHIFSTSRHLGPKLIMIIRMFVDLIIFVCILVVFLLAYGISVEIILYPNTPRPFTVLLSIIERAYFQIFGELFLDDMGKDVICTTNITEQTLGMMPCPENTWFGMLALAFYLFLSNILLLNLLIAMLNFTFQAIQDNCDVLWKFQRLGLLQEYYSRPPLPPPFIIIFQFTDLMCYIWRKTFGKCCYGCSACQRTKSFKRQLDEDLNEEITTWESVKGQDFVIKARQKLRSEAIDVYKLTNDRFDKINQDLAAMKNYNLKHVDDRLSKIEDQLKVLIASSKGSQDQSDH